MLLAQVVAKRVHDYRRIMELERCLQSERWPQGVLTTQNGLFYVCHFQGEVLVLLAVDFTSFQVNRRQKRMISSQKSLIYSPNAAQTSHFLGSERLDRPFA